MRPRPRPLPEPPDRAPYVRVRAGADVLVLRVPSLHRVGVLARAMGEDNAKLLGLLRPGAKLIDLVQQGPALLELIGALIGCAWVDPGLELETPAPHDWSPECTRAYGLAVHEELHEAGWSLGRQLAAAGALFAEITEAARVEEEVLKQARFFGRRTATTSGAPPPSTPPGPESPSAEGSPR